MCKDINYSVFFIMQNRTKIALLDNILCRENIAHIFNR